ncbi:HAMP domain-containing sensor histidine kinase [Paenibacillus roseipurpureus]|uniref:histidine kinase n=1 Tax=Paenibacillus roseopurpureus TaxID=2918901 RepID=A0AA96LNT7_9BACL|nr:HAMP domain-containing sensor histidine kinase [Paenibacillus sp. MBLB1832]WNR44547.1 HAMP domain-containing sensor histidine kinase [Paenibacillus sp. MBLB1832]
MKRFHLILVLLIFGGAAFLALLLYPYISSAEDSNSMPITTWKVQWIPIGAPEDAQPDIDGEWISATAEHPFDTIPNGKIGAWIHLTVPPTTNLSKPGLYIERLYAMNVMIYENGKPVYQVNHSFDFERTLLQLPLDHKEITSDLYLRLTAKERAGISSNIQLGEFPEISQKAIRKELPDLLLGGGFVFLSLLMFLCSWYLNLAQRSTALALTLFVMCSGILIMTYSAMPYYYFPELGHFFVFIFDTSIYILFPALLYFVTHIFEGRYPWIKRMFRWLVVYYLISFCVMVCYKIIGTPLYSLYAFLTLWLGAPLIIGQLILISVLAFRNAMQNPNSLILSLGILILALSGMTDLLLLYAIDTFHMFNLWKLGIIILIASLVMILNRRIASDYARLLSYSKELELYNHQLQRTEKMQIISELAASIAHEVRNPLQVTRGFLQLLSGKSVEHDKSYFAMAIQELDRASGIITDFLTFAKPELDTRIALNLQHELAQIETMMTPLVLLNNGELEVHVPEPLIILGNSSKFKQALINIIKNSIESIREEGHITINAWAEEGTAVIRIADNGEGMEPEQLEKLGEPYFSTKTKGTGLGLMVTFRIIEVMEGTLKFHSEKGKGTEAIVRFPLVSNTSSKKSAVVPQ